eukprot:gene9345-6568_t
MLMMMFMSKPHGLSRGLCFLCRTPFYLFIQRNIYIYIYQILFSDTCNAMQRERHNFSSCINSVLCPLHIALSPACSHQNHKKKQQLVLWIKGGPFNGKTYIYIYIYIYCSIYISFIPSNLFMDQLFFYIKKFSFKSIPTVIIIIIIIIIIITSYFDGVVVIVIYHLLFKGTHVFLKGTTMGQIKKHVGRVVWPWPSPSPFYATILKNTFLILLLYHNPRLFHPIPSHYFFFSFCFSTFYLCAVRIELCGPPASPTPLPASERENKGRKRECGMSSFRVSECVRFQMVIVRTNTNSECFLMFLIFANNFFFFCRSLYIYIFPCFKYIHRKSDTRKHPRPPRSQEPGPPKTTSLTPSSLLFSFFFFGTLKKDLRVPLSPLTPTLAVFPAEQLTITRFFSDMNEHPLTPVPLMDRQIRLRTMPSVLLLLLLLLSSPFDVESHPFHDTDKEGDGEI